MLKCAASERKVLDVTSSWLHPASFWALEAPASSAETHLAQEYALHALCSRP